MGFGLIVAGHGLVSWFGGLVGGGGGGGSDPPSFFPQGSTNWLQAVGYLVLFLTMAVFFTLMLLALPLKATWTEHARFSRLVKPSVPVIIAVLVLSNYFPSALVEYCYSIRLKVAYIGALIGLCYLGLYRLRRPSAEPADETANLRPASRYTLAVMGAAHAAIYLGMTLSLIPNTFTKMPDGFWDAFLPPHHELPAPPPLNCAIDPYRQGSEAFIRRKHQIADIKSWRIYDAESYALWEIEHIIGACPRRDVARVEKQNAMSELQQARDDRSGEDCFEIPKEQMSTLPGLHQGRTPVAPEEMADAEFRRAFDLPPKMNLPPRRKFGVPEIDGLPPEERYDPEGARREKRCKKHFERIWAIEARIKALDAELTPSP